VSGSPCSVAVCHGCCCARDGEERAPAALDRLALLQRLVAGSGVVVQVVGCLGPCEQRDVVVVRPAAEARLAGARPVWLGRVLDEPGMRAVAAWARAGGPGQASLPRALTKHRFLARSRPRLLPVPRSRTDSP
jgi:(2Fe-2S) ferredoxin